MPSSDECRKRNCDCYCMRCDNAKNFIGMHCGRHEKRCHTYCTG